MAKIFEPAWDDAINPERKEMVFEKRNKEYGAYPIRKRYTTTASRALLISILLFTLMISLPVIVQMISGYEDEKSDKPVEVTVELKEPPPIDKNEPPPPPPPPPPPTIETVKFTPPVVVDREIEDEDQPPPQEELNETNVV
jgi:protein TonB